VQRLGGLAQNCSFKPIVFLAVLELFTDAFTYDDFSVGWIDRDVSLIEEAVRSLRMSSPFESSCRWDKV